MKNGTVVVVGSGGKQGQSCILDLLRNKDAENIIAVDMNQKALAQLQQRTANDARLEIKNFSVEDHPKLVQLLEKSNICINGLVYALNLDIMDVCLEAACHYIDFGGLFHMTKKQWQMHDRFKDRAITAILGMGSCPGTTNVTARYAVDQLDTVSEVHAICGVRSEEIEEVKSKRSLSDETSYVLRSHVIGVRDGQSIEYFIDTLVPQCPQWGLNEEELGTGTSPAIAASMMLRGLVSQTGVFPPEAIIPAEPYLSEIEKRFMPTKITETRNFAASR